ncbi:MAG: SDR family oxidoreductase [Bacteroidia bacterium]|jgi:short-subunit dehydrogenase|nr:SDR family oxidoreductase [Bacteroidia bacterium]MCW5918219.1 SDR family oxidoreductase [Bacteroidota bacterium]HMU76794.1 SDR family oxidoreductase [Bacteroidia bacterium]HMW11156.1 SDR family oxidoreductase [Bacteroidia bacterium]HMX96765.1 SDR family oxidoreductase [Bacteroidia bacterium]
MNIVVTGASSGIGLELVKSFTLQNHNVLAVSRSKEKLTELKRFSESIHILSIDINRLNSEVITETLIKSKMKHIDILINNAGVLVKKPFVELTESDWLETYNTNVFGVANMIQCCMPYILKSQIRHIVNISSMGGVGGTLKFPGLSAYSSSKGAVTILTECLAEEFKSDAIKVNGLALGAVQTPMLEKAFPELKTFQTPENIVPFISWFALEAHKWCNGKIMQVSDSTP